MWLIIIICAIAVLVGVFFWFLAFSYGAYLLNLSELYNPMKRCANCEAAYSEEVKNGDICHCGGVIHE